MKLGRIMAMAKKDWKKTVRDPAVLFMKRFHTFLIPAVVGLGITGAVQLFFAPWWNYSQLLHSAIEPWWRPTWIHDALGFSLIALVVAHAYFALLRVNRPVLRSMVVGYMLAVHAKSLTKIDSPNQ